MKSSFIFFTACILGIALIGGACSSSSSANPTALTDTESVNPVISKFNRYASIGFYICGEFLPAIPDTNLESDTNSNAAPYYLENGIIHIPSLDEAGFLTPVRLGDIGQFIAVQDSSFIVTDDTLFLKRGEEITSFSEMAGCDGRPANLSITRWEISASGGSVLESPQVFAEDLAGVTLTKTAEAITISLIPPGSTLPPLPLSTLELIQINDVIAAGNLPTARQLELVPVRPSPPPKGLEITQNPTPCPPAESEPAIRVTQFSHFPDNCLDPLLSYTAVFETTAGDIHVELDTSTYDTTNAFFVLARYLYYDESALFRTEPLQGIIQGGAPHTNRVDDPGPGFTIPDETLTFDYAPGQLLMARNQGTNSANGQFIFSVTDNAERLEASGNVVFGKVIQGMDILRRILSLHVEDPAASEEAKFFLGGPIRPVILKRVLILTTG